MTMLRRHRPRRFRPLLLPLLLTGCASTATLPARYADQDYWRRYLTALPDGGVLAAAPVVEERWTWRGLSVHLDRLEPDTTHTTPRGTVILVHGGGGNGRLVMAVGPALARDGWRVVAPDLPGYGLTTPADTPATVSQWTALVAELARTLRQETRAPVFLFGLSVGSWVAYNAVAGGAPVDGIAVTMLGDPQDGDVVRAVAGSWWKARLLLPLGRVTAPVSDRMRVRLAQLVPLEGMSNDTALVRLLRDDPLIGRRPVRLGLLRSFAQMRLAVPPERYAGPPVLIVHPGADRWTPAALTRRSYARLAGRKRMVELEGGSHLPAEPAAWARMVEELRAFFAARAAVTRVTGRAPGTPQPRPASRSPAHAETRPSPGTEWPAGSVATGRLAPA